MVEEERQNKSSSTDIQRRTNKSRDRLSLARKILTLLFNYDIRRPEQEEVQYIKLCDLFADFFPDAENPLEMLLDINNMTVFNNIAQALFHMNSYNPRTENWLQLIDIQYNVSVENNAQDPISIEDASTFQDLIRTHYRDINLRITNAGKAYLYFVVYHFEFFSCRTISNQESKLPPLLCMIPTAEQIENSDIQNLPCISIIESVKKEAISSISKINRDNNSIGFLKDGNLISHSQRIVNSHQGYLNNFVQCIESLYSTESEQSSKVDELIDTITRIRDQYKIDFIDIEGE